MKNIEQLIYESERVLEKNNQGVRGVGNRPHNPMLVLYNEAFLPEHIRAVNDKLERIWPQTLHTIANYRCVARNQKLSFADAVSGDSVTGTDVMDALDNVKKARDVFASMRHWRVYNVVDTTPFASVDAFIEHYTALEQIKSIVVDAHKSMLIVLLDDSTASRETATAIRRYLSENSLYDSTIVISNRTRNNEMYDMEELYRIVADVMLLSNNDAISSFDDEDYKHRVSVLYNNATFTLSYVLKERPNRKIAVQMDHHILSDMLRRLEKSPNTDVMAWSKAIGFQDGKSAHCEEFLKSLKFRIDPASFAHLPMRPTALNDKLDFSQMSYAQFKQYTYSDVLATFAQNYCEKALRDDVDVSACVDAFRTHLLDSFDACDLAAITDDMIDRLMALLQTTAVNENTSVSDYFERCVHAALRTDCIYPAFRDTLRDLRDKATQVIETAKTLEHDFQRHLPLGLEQDLGTVYTNAVNNYLVDEAGMRTLRTVCRPGNDKEDILQAIFTTFSAIVKKNLDLFALPFIEEWERRLNMTGDRIYREISTVLTDGVDEMIRLYGNAPTDYRLKVYMLHTTDAAGDHPTDLYNHLKETFREDPFVQYFNTGYDDALEAISFVACERTKLLL